MADPHVVLAPLAEPPLPPLPVDAPATTLPLPWLVALLALILIAGLALWWWRRRAPQRALRRICRLGDPLQAAHQLARWQQRHACVVTPAWQQTLDRLRFGPTDEAGAATLQRLCDEAATFARPG